ncbi:MAG: radical SAM protein, partial [Chloroflexota bacterium]|nr:radical SAM protein [Chloroflexota bacterium]
ETDARRGHGAFDRVMRAMDSMRERGLIFSFSTCVTKNNVDQVTSDEWIDMLIEKGCRYGWYFIYMPVGGDRTTALMPTPEQRNRLRLATSRIRNTKPILLADFWGDSPLTGGCIAGGRLYAHINHKGDLEPCVFCHFTCPGANVKEVSLAQALSAPLFAHWRQMQPFSANALRPCPIIDHPKVLRAALKAWGAVPSHPEAENVVDLLAKDLDRYSAELSKIYDPVWDEEYPWGPEWMTIMDYPKEKVLRRRAAYQEKRVREKQETRCPAHV